MPYAWHAARPVFSISVYTQCLQHLLLGETLLSCVGKPGLLLHSRPGLVSIPCNTAASGILWVKPVSKRD